ncbi:defensin-1 [Copidosoma floridanum]|uniref:defensin-1 n=1 Tax=Copidosoma floridanum TaxID=29053 RepID=UPI000C6FC35E|nr:defensin-1 [Copidosoma floridanum]
MKVSLLFLVFTVLLCVIHALPFDGFEDANELEFWQGTNDGDGVRQRRVTCDLMSYGGKVGHAACAANCLSMGKAGGRCNDGTCQCRKFILM